MRKLLILIVVVVLMNTLTSNGTDNLPQAVLPPKPKSQATQKIQEELETYSAAEGKSSGIR